MADKSGITVQRKLRKRREEFFFIPDRGPSKPCFITRFSDSHYLLRTGLGVLKWFHNEDAALDWMTFYVQGGAAQ